MIFILKRKVMKNNNINESILDDIKDLILNSDKELASNETYQKLKKYFNTVELSNFEKGLVMSDFHHLNVVGHRELARVINAKIFDFEK